MQKGVIFFFPYPKVDESKFGIQENKKALS
jgi:hypothetical protein